MNTEKLTELISEMKERGEQQNEVIKKHKSVT